MLFKRSNSYIKDDKVVRRQRWRLSCMNNYTIGNVYDWATHYEQRRLYGKCKTDSVEFQDCPSKTCFSK